MTLRPLAIPLLTATLLLTACQQPTPEPPTATLQPAPTPTPASSSPSPPTPPPPTAEDYAIPEVMDEAYVERVLQALYDVEDDAVQLMLSANSMTEQSKQMLAAIYDAQQLEPQVELYRQAAAEGFPDLLRDPGSQTVEVYRVISSRPDCLFVAGLRDFADVLASPRDRSGEEDFIQLLSKDEGQDPLGLNPTPWVIGGSVTRTDGSEPDDPCA